MSVVPPRRSYIIWFSQRVGSTLLTQTLEDTGIAGRPREWFNDPAGAGLLAKYAVSDAEALRALLWREGTTANGVFGVKHSMGEHGDDDLTSLFAGVIPGEPDPDGRKAWQAFFPSCKHVFMTRRNKLRLAVSWWRATQSGAWHLPNRTGTAFGDAPVIPSEIDGSDKYDRDAIQHLLVEATLREAAISERLDRWGVVPHTIVYEDFIASYQPTVRRLLAFLELASAQPAIIPSPSFERLADEISETWYQRFRREREAR